MPPVPVLSLAIMPKTTADREKLDLGLQELIAQDSTIHVQIDEQTGQAIVACTGEPQLEIICDRLKREFSVEATLGKPQVAYKETLTRPFIDVEISNVVASVQLPPAHR